MKGVNIPELNIKVIVTEPKTEDRGAPLVLDLESSTRGMEKVRTKVGDLKYELTSFKREAAGISNFPLNPRIRYRNYLKCFAPL